VYGYQVALADHPVDVGVDRADLREQCLGGRQAIGRPRVVIDEVLGQDFAKCGSLTSPERFVEPVNDRLVRFGLMLGHFAAFL
jgi:hypothetical protein